MNSEGQVRLANDDERQQIIALEIANLETQAAEERLRKEMEQKEMAEKARTDIVSAGIRNDMKIKIGELQIDQMEFNLLNNELSVAISVNIVSLIA